MTPADELFRLLMVAGRKYSRDPASRPAAARLLVSASIHLLAVETDEGDAALTVGEVVGEMAAAKRRKQQALRVVSARGAAK